MASGIFLSRIAGLIRQRVLAHYLGLSVGNDAFTAAFRIPNLLQNLLGEGVLSASFIPVYARLRAEDRETEARQVADAVFSLLAVVTAALVLAGVALAAPLTDLVAPGFEGGARDLTIRLVRVLFPGAGLLVLSAWCLGVLNSHRRFFLPYAAPVVWNLGIIATVLLAPGRHDEFAAAEAAALGSLIGSALQFALQVPSVLRLLGGLRPALRPVIAPVRQVLRNLGPVILGRGVVQISAFVDTMIASLLGAGAVAGIGTAQMLYMLPVSLFGISISAAELPAMASSRGTVPEVAAALQRRLQSGLQRIGFFVIPCAVAFLALGGVIIAALFQTGRFTAGDSAYVWTILAGSAIGLLASTQGRLYSSAFYSLNDTRTPLRAAVVRVTLAAVLGVSAALYLPGLLQIGPQWGAAGITAGAGIAAWVELRLLRNALRRRLGGVPPVRQLHLLGAAALAGLVGRGLFQLLPPAGPVLTAVVVLGAFGGVYLAVTLVSGDPTARALYAQFRPEQK